MQQMKTWLVILFLSRKKCHAKQIFVLSSSMKLGPGETTGLSGNYQKYPVPLRLLLQIPLMIVVFEGLCFFSLQTQTNIYLVTKPVEAAA